MADTTIESEFITSFHSLSGVTIKERSQNLHQLLNKTQHLLKLSSGKISLSSLIPTTPLEESFKITALIYFKCTNELLNVLKCENPSHIERVLNHSSWVLKEASIDWTPEYLATELFSNISYNTKQKLLNKLSYHLNDENKTDKYFEAIKEHYGYYLASKLLPCCSSKLILECLDLYKTELTPKQLLLIIKKYPNLTETIFEKVDNQNAKIRTGEKYKLVIKYLSKTDLDLFVKIYEKYSPSIQLGPKETASFIKSALKSNVFTKNKKLHKILKTKQIGKSMGKDFASFYQNNFPKQISEVKHSLSYQCKILRYLPKDSLKINMFSSTFKQIYGNEVWDYNDLKQSILIEWMSPDERTAWLESHSKPYGIAEEVWISYYKTEKSIPLLKEKIVLLSNADTRSKYLKALLKTCKINRDESALLDVLKYVNIKHRNDQSLVIQGFLQTFNEFYNQNQLSEEHWNEIFRCMQLFSFSKGYYHYNIEILEKCIYYRISHKKPIQDILEYFVKNYPYNYTICKIKRKFKKRCLIELEELVPIGYPESELSTGYMFYFQSICNYNIENPQDKIVITMKSEYIEYIKTFLQKHTYESYGAALLLIMQDSKRAEDEGILELLFKSKHYDNYQLIALQWLLKENPLLVRNHLQNIINVSNMQYKSKLLKKFCQRYSHLEIPEKICRACNDFINDKDQRDRYKIRSAIYALSLLSTPQSFLKFSSLYYPTELSPNLESQSNQMFYIKQQAVADYLRNIVPVSKNLECLLHFCKGDYLKFVQRSIATASNNVVENKLYEFFNTLKERAVSVRKHAIFLSAKVLDKTFVNRMLLELTHKEKNPSLRKVVLKTIFHSFLNDPTDQIFNLVKQFMGAFDTSDIEGFDILTTCQQVPLKYFYKYLQFSWNILEQCSCSKEAIENGRVRLLNMVNSKNISAIPDEFCETLIEKNLFNCKNLTKLQKSIHSLTCKYMIYGPGDEQKRIHTVFLVFKNYKDQSWREVLTRPLMYKLIGNFLEEYCEHIIDKQCTNRGNFKKFFNMWESILQPHETFDEFVILNLTLIYLNILEKKLMMNDIAKEVASLCNLLLEKDCFVAELFTFLLNKFLTKIYDLDFIEVSDENKVVFIESLINNGSHSFCLELAINLMPSQIPITVVVKKRYDDIIKIISAEANHSVQISFHKYLRLLIIPED